MTICIVSSNLATGYASQHYLVPVPSQGKLGGCGSKGNFCAIHNVQNAHEFIITGDFNIHVDNPADTLTSQFLSLLSILVNTSTSLRMTKTTFSI